MKKNMGNLDKLVRMLAALVIVILAFTKVITGIWAVVLLILAVILLLTSLFGICPLYVPFGLNTGKKKE
jgi:hypothetical protein